MKLSWKTGDCDRVFTPWKILIIKHADPPVVDIIKEIASVCDQAECMNYAAHLAKMLQDQEENPPRKEFLATLARRCTALHDRVTDLLK